MHGYNQGHRSMQYQQAPYVIYSHQLQRSMTAQVDANYDPSESTFDKQSPSYIVQQQPSMQFGHQFNGNMAAWAPSDNRHQQQPHPMSIQVPQYQQVYTANHPTSVLPSTRSYNVSDCANSNSGVPISYLKSHERHNLPSRQPTVEQSEQNKLQFYRRFKKIALRTPDKNENQQVTSFDHIPDSQTSNKNSFPPSQQLLYHYQHIQDVQDFSSPGESDIQFPNSEHQHQPFFSDKSNIRHDAIPETIFQKQSRAFKSFQENTQHPRQIVNSSYQIVTNHDSSQTPPGHSQTIQSIPLEMQAVTTNHSIIYTNEDYLQKMQFYNNQPRKTSIPLARNHQIMSQQEVMAPRPNIFEKQASDQSHSANKQVRFNGFEFKDDQSDNSILKKINARKTRSTKYALKSSHSPKLGRVEAHSPFNEMKRADSFLKIHSRLTKSIKSNRSGISSISSYTAKSTSLPKRLKKNKSSRSNLSNIKRQQEEEYDKFSAKKSQNSRIENAEKFIRSKFSSKKRKSGKSGSTKPDKKIKTILIDCNKLSQYQLKQIERITKIINNQPGEKTQKSKSTSPKKQKAKKNQDIGQSILLSQPKHQHVYQQLTNQPQYHTNQMGMQFIDPRIQQYPPQGPNKAQYTTLKYTIDYSQNGSNSLVDYENTKRLVQSKSGHILEQEIPNHQRNNRYSQTSSCHVAQPLTEKNSFTTIQNSKSNEEVPQTAQTIEPSHNILNSHMTQQAFSPIHLINQPLNETQIWSNVNIHRPFGGSHIER